MNDIKVLDSLREMMRDNEMNAALPFHALAFFAEAVAMTRQEETAVSIEDVAKCFLHQFDEAELSALIHQLNQGKL